MKRRFRERRKGASPHYQGERRRREDREEPRTGARRRRSAGSEGYWAHRRALARSLQRMRHTPLATWFTILVIGIALSLPTGLDLAVDNLSRLAETWQRGADLSLFLEEGREDDDARRLAQRLRQDPDIAAVRLITRAQALEELRRLPGMDEALTVLGDNPLPPVLVVTPRDDDMADALRARLAALPEVAVVQRDTQWVARLQAILALFDRAALLLGLLSLVGVAVIVGNTLRLVSQSYLDELRVSHLLGATDGYLLRPFLYAGLIYGAAGAAVAWLLVHLALLWLGPALDRLTHLYQSDFHLQGLSLHALGLLALGGPALGLVTAWIVIRPQLKRLDD